MGRDAKKFLELIAIMKKLRSPEGCPWDKEQDMNTLKSYVVEEAYEVLEAIDRNSPHELMEELETFSSRSYFFPNLPRKRGFLISTMLLPRSLKR